MKNSADKTKLLPDAKKVLEKIKKNNIKIGLVTNSYKSQVNRILDFHKIKKHFKVIVAGDEIERPKPYPDPILKACKQLKVDPDEVLYVGDTKIDYKAGKSAGCYVVGLNTHGDLMISRLSDLLQLI